MVNLNYKDRLLGGKNLLAFSAGVDSSALFFLLLDSKIEFDIALVNYGTREQSFEEERYALQLAKEYNLKAHTIKAPKFSSNFEKSARDFRYNFFEQLIEEYGYRNLITAHQLNDQLEWFLMRLTKGAGVTELLGLEDISERGSYTLIRPILNHSKEELLDYLERNGHRYFIDATNSDERYERNYFRREFSDRLISRYRSGVERSFRYLKEDRDILMGGYREIFSHKEFYIIEVESSHIKIRVIDRYLKRLGYLLSSAQREEIKDSSSVVFGGEWSVELRDNLIFISPYIRVVIPKRYKELYRVAKVPPKVRGYLYSERVEPNIFAQLY